MLTIDTLKYYSVSPFIKLFILLRLASCPFNEILHNIPDKDTLLDVGTGYCLLPLLLLLRKPTMEITGIDPDKGRIVIDQKLSKKFKNLRIKVGSAESFNSNKKYDVVTLIDVLYLIPLDTKRKILTNMNKLLNNKGYLLVKINDRSISVQFFLTWLQEFLTVHILKKTETKYSGLHFENVAELHELLKECNFKIKKTVKLSTPFPFFHPHWLVVAVK